MKILNFKVIFLIILSILIIPSYIFAQRQSNTVSVNTNPPGAYFTIGTDKNTKYGPTPTSFAVTANNYYELTFTKEGYYPLTITYKADGSPINVTLQPITYTLSIGSNITGADIFINNQAYGKTPMNTTLSQGTYNVIIKYSGYKDFMQTVNLYSNQSINAVLEQDLFINIKLPKGAKVYINGQLQNISWNPNDNWNTFTFYSTSPKGLLKIEYNNLSIEKNIDFNRTTLTLLLELK